ncbi:MAG TPA: MFS transporter [Opitutales bacterium]|nr:MFS transporter [Opitutales bacterium]
MTTEKVSFREKLCYGAGDFASVLYWQTFMIYLLYFYTDVFGISAAAAGTMFLVSRVLDGITDPVVGMIADRTETRWGKFRPYLLWFCVPFAIVGVLTFTAPDLAETGKLVWAYVTYNALMLLYTIINIPYTSMLGVISSDTVQRTSLSSFKFVGAYTAGVVISALLLPVVIQLGGKMTVHSRVAEVLISAGAQVEFTTPDGLTAKALAELENKDDLPILSQIADSTATTQDNGMTPLHLAAFAGDLEQVQNLIKEGSDVNALTAEGYSPLHVTALSPTGLFRDVAKNEKRGWQLSFMAVGFVAILCFLVAFAGTRERVKPVQEKKNPVSSDIKDLISNKPWLILLATTITFILFVATRSTATVHYFKYYVGEQNLNLPFGFASGKYGFEWLVSIFNVIGQFSSIVGVVLLPFVTAVLGKKKTFMIYGVIAIVSTAAFYVLKPDQIEAMFLLQVLGSITGGPLSALIWAMYADTADYGEWKNGRRATGLVFSASTMSQKLGWAIGGAIAGWLLTTVGFEANMIPTPEVMKGLMHLMSLIPAGFGLVFLIIVSFYPLNEKKVAEIGDVLKELHKAKNE